MWVPLAVFLHPGPAHLVDGGPGSHQVEGDSFLRARRSCLVGERVRRLIALDSGVPRYPLEGYMNLVVGQLV